MSNISNAIVDFRLHSTDNGKPQVRCLNLKSFPESVHCLVTIRQKHPRTNYKITRRHEHFRLSSDVASKLEFINAEKLLAELALSKIHRNENEESKSSNTSTATTFNLNLNKEALEAKNKLILPYIK